MEYNFKFKKGDILKSFNHKDRLYKVTFAGFSEDGDAFYTIELLAGARSEDFDDDYVWRAGFLEENLYIKPNQSHKLTKIFK